MAVRCSSVDQIEFTPSAVGGAGAQRRTETKKLMSFEWSSPSALSRSKRPDYLAIRYCAPGIATRCSHMGRYSIIAEVKFVARRNFRASRTRMASRLSSPPFQSEKIACAIRHVHIPRRGLHCHMISAPQFMSMTTFRLTIFENSSTLDIND